MGLPNDITGFCVQCHKFGIKRAEINEIAENLDAAVIWTTAVSRHGSHLVLVVPDFCTGLGVKCINMAKRSRHIHDAIYDDGRSLKRFLDLGLKNPRNVEVLDIITPDLPGRMKARLR